MDSPLCFFGAAEGHLLLASSCFLDKRNSLWCHDCVSKDRSTIPIKFPYQEHIIILGEYWLQDLQQVENATIASGGPPPVADAYTITDHPGPNYNCSTNVVPPYMNTIGVPSAGWAAICFVSDNPGVWYMHCRLDIHKSWGLGMVFIVNNGKGELESLPHPPPDLPQC
ncbi:Laccase-6 [Glycine soja]